MGNKGSQTTTQTQTPNPAALGAYGALLSQIPAVAGANPWQSYGGEMVAPVNAQQYGGIGGINNYATAAQPGLNMAEWMAFNASSPIGASQISQYENPYTQQVVGATQNVFNQQNAQQQQQLLANAAAQGALGGNRVGVAQANLAEQQQLGEAPALANLESQGYTQAVQTALAEQQAQQAGAYGVGNIAQAIQGAGLSGAGAQIQAGTLEQQTQQQLDAALYNQFLMQQAFPYQQLGWETGLTTGVGSQMGGTSQTVGPPPSLLSQIAGLGLAGVGVLGGTGGFGPQGYLKTMFSDRGGRVPHRQAGGPLNLIGQPLYGGVGGYIPQAQVRMGPGAPKPPGAPSSGATQMVQDAQKIAQAFKGSGNANPATGVGLNPNTPYVATAGGVAPAEAYEEGAATGGGILDRLPRHDRITMRPGFGFGGTIPAYQGGGPTPDDPVVLPDGTIDHGTIILDPADVPGQGVAPATLAAQRAADANAVALTQGRGGVEGLPPLVTTGNAGMPAGALPFTTTTAGYPPPVSVAPTTGGIGAPSSNLWPALMAAGFGMMSSRSPFAGVAIGEGGLRGLQTYEQLGQEQRKEALTQQEIGLRAQALMQQAENSRKTLDLHNKQLEETKAWHGIEGMKPVVVKQEQVFDPLTGATKTRAVYGVRGSDGKYRDPITGKEIDAATQPAAPTVPPGVFASPSAPGAAPVPPPAPTIPKSDWPAFAAGGPVGRQEGGPLPAPATASPAPSGALFGIPGENPDLVGEDYLRQFSPSFQAAVKDYVAGRSLPLSNPRAPAVAWVKRAAQKYGQDIGNPVDDTTFAARRTYRTQLASTQPGAAGGQMNLMTTSLGHLADVAQRAEALNNWNGWNIPGGHWIATKANEFRSTYPDQAALVNALGTAAQRYSGEVEKLYSGSRSSMTEREETAKRYSGAQTSRDFASGLGTDLELIHAKLNALEEQRDRVLGPAGADVHFLSPQNYANIDTVQGVVNRLRGIGIDDRYKQLKSTGQMNEDQIRSRLHAEGYSMPGIPGAPSAQFNNGLRAEAEVAIRSGAPKDKVLERLRQQGIDTSGL